MKKNAFQNCTALENVNLGKINSLGDLAFLQCTSLKKIKLPETLEHIGYNPFSYCEKLAEINVDTNSKSFASVDGLLYSKDLSTVYVYPKGSAEKTLVLPSEVTVITAGAFSNTSIKSVTLPAGLKSIGNSSFSDCRALVGIELPAGLENIGYSAFDNCSALRGELIIPASLKTIGSSAFRRTAIQKVTINSNADISPGMFLECKYLASVSINSDVSKIGRGAFRSCSKLTNITLPKTLKTIESAAFESCSSLVNIVLPVGLVSIGESDQVLDELDNQARGGVFASCTKLKSIVIPDSVIYLERESFSDCKSLKSVVLSKNPKFTTINDRTFQRTPSLVELIIPKNVTTIEEHAFVESSFKAKTLK